MTRGPGALTLAALAVASLAACDGARIAPGDPPGPSAPTGTGGGATTGPTSGGGAGDDTAAPCPLDTAAEVHCFSGAVGEALVIAPDGAFFVGGTFTGHLDLGGLTLEGTGLQSPFVAKLGPDLAPLWVAAPASPDAGGPALDSADLRDLALGDDGSLLVTGTATPSPGTGAQTTYVAKLDASGALAWRRVFVLPPGTGPSSGISVAPGPDGTFAVAGFGPELMDLDPYDFGPPDYPVFGSGEVYVVALEPDGKPLWARYGDGGFAFPRALEADPEGGLLLSSEGQLDTGESTMSLRSIAWTGELLWERTFLAWGSWMSAERLPGGHVRSVGVFLGDLDLGLGGGPTYSESWGLAALELDAAGQPLWGVAEPSAAGIVLEAAVTESSGRTLFVGRYNTPLDDAFGPLATAGGSDVVLGGLGDGGALLGAMRYGGPHEDWPAAIALDPSGRPWVLAATLDVDPPTTALARFAPAF
jgi:hypothetical protein